MPLPLWTHFYHITHHANLPGLLQHGILSWTEAHARGLTATDISDPEVQNRRDGCETVYGRKIHDYAPLYINPRNPMLSKRREFGNELLILKVLPAVLERHQHVFTDGNAANCGTAFGPDRKVVAPSEPVLRAAYWNDFEDGKRQRCAEVLVHPLVESSYIGGAVCRSAVLAAQVRHLCPFPVTVDASVFFQEAN